jgi:hypothetical protein
MTASLQAKLKKVAELSQVIDLSSVRALPQTLRTDIENEQFRLEFALRTLVDECKEEEADLKIAAMQKVINLLNSNVSKENLPQ